MHGNREARSGRESIEILRGNESQKLGKEESLRRYIFSKDGNYFRRDIRNFVSEEKIEKRSWMKKKKEKTKKKKKRIFDG